MAAPGQVLVVACGALVKELGYLAAEINSTVSTSETTTPRVKVECLPAKWHNRPEKIPEGVRKRVRAARAKGTYDRILVGYADCGTGGQLDRVCEEEGVERLPGAHCYELYAGSDTFAQLQHNELGTFYLTDYLVRHFDRLIMDGLGLTAHPELRDLYFGHYTRLMYLAQIDDPKLDHAGQRAADQLGLRYERMFTGYRGLAKELTEVRVGI